MKNIILYVFFLGFIGLNACQNLPTTSKKYPDIRTAYRYALLGRCDCPYDRNKRGKLCEDDSKYALALVKEAEKPMCYLSDLE